MPAAAELCIGHVWGGGIDPADPSPPEPRLAQLRDAIQILLSDSPTRAQQVQELLSDKTPPPAP